MTNLFTSEQQRDFFVYVDPNDWFIQHNVGLIGTFATTPATPDDETLMFLPNPDFQTFISPFQNNLLRAYVAEYNLEIRRQSSFSMYPCRLQAMFLLEDEEEARKYAERHPDHVGQRSLKRVRTKGPHIYSVHDSAWIDFLRVGHSLDVETLDYVGGAYWSGELVKDHQLESMGKAWSQNPIKEALFVGRVDFYDRRL